MEPILLRDEFTTRLTDEQFFWFCQQNKDLRIERTNKLEIVIMSPVTSLSGAQSLEIARQLANWAITNGTGIAFDSSAGFTLADKSVFSPDAAWLSKKKWNELTAEEKDRFAPVCPEFIIEIRSKTDSIEQLKQKMEVWLKNGAARAWLIDPREGTTYIYRPGQPIETIQGLNKKLIGEGPVSGFALDLSFLLR